jgi:hypothetical protein
MGHFVGVQSSPAVAKVLKPRLTRLIFDTVRTLYELEPICIPICGHALRDISKPLANKKVCCRLGGRRRRQPERRRRSFWTTGIFVIF